MSDSYILPTEILQLVSAEFAYRYRVVPIGQSSTGIVFLSDSQEAEGLRNELFILTGFDVEIKPEAEPVIDKYLSTNYRKKDSGRQASEMHYSNDFLEKVLLNAKEMGSSDIHFEKYESRSRVRFRLDGKLKEQFYISNEEYPVIINKVKIRAQLDISEKRLPQDGRITVATEYEDFDIRVSVLPSLHGEKVVLRILSKDKYNFAFGRVRLK